MDLNVKSWVSTIGESLLYSIVLLLFMIAGYILNVVDWLHGHPGGSPGEKLLSIFGAQSRDIFIFSFISFVFYFYSRLKLLDRKDNADELRMETLGLHALFVSVGICLIAVIYVQLHGILTVWYIFGAVPPSVLLFQTIYLQVTKSDDELAKRFLPKIFFPVCSICSCSFLAGWGMSDPTYVNTIIYIAYLCGLTAVFSIGIASANNLQIAIVSVSSILIAATIVQMFDGQTYGRAMFMATLLTFAAGFAEVAKRPYLMKRKQVQIAKDESIDYYSSGANWSCILFLSFAPLVALYSSAPLTIYLAVFFPLLIVIWFSIKDKGYRVKYRVALLMGLSIPLVVSTLALVSIWTNLPVPLHNINKIEALATINGIFLTILFVLYPDDFKNLHGALYHSRTFQDARACAIFAAMIIAVEVVTIPLIFFLFEFADRLDSDTAQKASLILMATLAMSILLYILLFLIRSEGSSGGDSPGETRPSGLTAPSNASMRAIFKLRPLAVLCRPSSSALAGLCCVGVAAAGRPLDLQASLVLFCTGALLGAYGFAVNDLFDRTKDEAGGRNDKVLVAGMMEPYQVVVLSYILLVSLIVVSAGLSIESRMVALGLAALLTGYSAFAKRLPVLKGAYTAGMCCVLPFVGVLDQGSHVPPWIVATIFIYVLGREILIDVTEIKSDTAASFRTIGVIVGRHRGLLLAAAIMMMACVLFIVLAPISATSALVSASMVFSVMVAISASMRSRDQWALELTRMPMVLLIIVLGVASHG